MILRVNGELVDEQAIEGQFASIKAWHEGLANVCCCHRNEEFLDQAREQVVGWVLLNQEARRRLPSVEPARLDQAVAAWKREQYGDMPPAEPDGPPPPYEIALREQIEQHLRVEALVNSVCEGLKPPTDDEVRAYYETNLELFMTPEKVRASHLIKSVQRSETREAAYRELCALRERALAGEDFDALAADHTDREDKQVDLGYFALEDLPAEFALCAFSMRDGEVSPVLMTQYGLHLIRITGREPARPRPFDEVAGEARTLMEQERRAARVGALVERLRASAEVEEVQETEQAGQGASVGR